MGERYEARLGQLYRDLQDCRTSRQIVGVMSDAFDPRYAAQWLDDVVGLLDWSFDGLPGEHTPRQAIIEALRRDAWDRLFPDGGRVPVDPADTRTVLVEAAGLAEGLAGGQDAQLPGDSHGPDGTVR